MAAARVLATPALIGCSIRSLHLARDEPHELEDLRSDLLDAN
jgi:hypothetical protein